MMGKSSDLEAAIRLNLSYVLHEPSTSQVTSALVRQVLANRRRIAAATRHLSMLPDLALLTRVVPRDPHRLWEVQAEPPHTLLTLHLGAWPLLGRVVALHLGQQQPPAALYLLDDEPVGHGLDLSLFRASAHLALPPAALLRRHPSCFATLVFRPGWRTLLLDLTPLTADPIEAWEQWATSLTSALEAALRDFCDQWLGRRALWEVAAERALPEFCAEGG